MKASVAGPGRVEQVGGVDVAEDGSEHLRDADREQDRGGPWMIEQACKMLIIERRRSVLVDIKLRIDRFLI